MAFPGQLVDLEGQPGVHFEEFLLRRLLVAMFSRPPRIEVGRPWRVFSVMGVAWARVVGAVHPFAPHQRVGME